MGKETWQPVAARMVMTSLSVQPYVHTQHHRKTNANYTLKYAKPVLPLR